MFSFNVNNSDHSFAHSLRSVWGARFGGLPREFWALWRAVFVNRLGGCVEPFLALYFAYRGLSAGSIGLCVALVGVGAIFAQLLGGILADKVGRRDTFAFGMVAAAVSFSLFPTATEFWQLALGSFLAGLFVEMYKPAAGALVSDLVVARDRRRAFGLLMWVGNLGFSVAAFVAGILAEGGYTLLFVVDALTCLLCAVLIWRTLPRETRPKFNLHPNAKRGMRAVLSDRLFLVFIGLTTVSSLILCQCFTTLPIAMKETGFGPAHYGAVIAINGVIIVVVQPLLFPALSRCVQPRLLAIGAALIGLGVGLEGRLDGAIGYALPIIVWTIGEIAFNTAAASIVGALAPAHLRGRYQGAYGFGFAVALTGAPAIGGLILQYSGQEMLWNFCLIAGLTVAGAMLILAPTLISRTKRCEICAETMIHSGCRDTGQQRCRTIAVTSSKRRLREADESHSPRTAEHRLGIAMGSQQRTN